MGGILGSITGSITGKKSKSRTQTTKNIRERPGLFGTTGFETAADLAKKARSATFGADAFLDVPVREASSNFRNPLVNAILNPSFGATSASEEALLDEIASRTQGASALRGLGPASQGALAQNLAPALINLRQQRIGNLQRAFGQDIGSNLQQRQQDIGLRLGESEARRQEQAANIERLIRLAQLARPTFAELGTDVRTRGTSIGGSLKGTFGVGGGGEDKILKTLPALTGGTSDGRLKEDITDFTRGLDDILGIDTVTFKWKEDSGYDDDKCHSGFIAQNVNECIPEAVKVNEDESGMLYIEDRALIATLINAVKELKREVDELKGK